jgi:hypothetical protein
MYKYLIPGMEDEGTSLCAYDVNCRAYSRTNETTGDDVSFAVTASIVATHFKDPERRLLVIKKIQNSSRPSSFLQFLETKLFFFTSNNSRDEKYCDILNSNLRCCRNFTCISKQL